MSSKTVPSTPSAPSSPAAEARSRLLARVAFEAVWERDLDSGSLIWDGSPESIFGYQLGEVGNHVSWWRNRVHPDDLGQADGIAAEAMRDGSAGWSGEYRFRRKDGSWAWVASRCAIERDATGRAVRAVGAMIDVSQLKETEHRLRLFTEQLPARACATDRELRVVWDSGAGFHDTPSVVGRTVSELFQDSPDRERVLEGCRKALAGESCTLETDDGTAAACLELVPCRDPAGDVIGVIGLALDITDRVRSEQTIQAGQRLLRQVLDTLPIGVAVVDRAGDILLYNPASSRIWGKTIVDGQERWARSKGFWHDSGKPIGPTDWASHAALEKGETRLNELIDIESFDGQCKIIENSVAPVRDEKGSVSGAVIVNQDVTARVWAEEALRRTERVLVEAAQLGQTGSWEEDLGSGRVFNMEENRRLFFGDDRTKGALLEDYAQAVHPDDRDRVLKRREQLLAGTGSRDIEYRVVWPDGSLHWICGRATVVRDPTGRAIRLLGTNADITERKRAEEAMRESATRLQHLSHRLLAVQEEERRHLSRELHDEFGQLIATVTVRLHAAREVAGEAAAPHLDECAALLRRAGEQLRNLALELRPPMLDSVGLEATLHALAKQHQVSTGISIQVLGHVQQSVSSDLATTCYRVAQEALTNIARHAQARHVWIELNQSETRLELVVRDDGLGFEVARTLEHAAQSGHLGLLGMRERVEILGGTLEVQSEPGRGTRLRISLPSGL